ncbi:MAG: spiro-SPASM protein [Spirochaetaceae bacterium]|jgi:spiro-SPASM protein|nr:spiro-SPASM protein [Spirochaetaceae bacterium]
MKACALLYGGGLNKYAFEDLGDGNNSFVLALRKTIAFKGVTKVILLVSNDFNENLLPADVKEIELVRRETWNTNDFLQEIVRAGKNLDLIYVAWADTPFLDPQLAEKLEARHSRYAAEYSYADGWPVGLAPELLSPKSAELLLKLNGGGETPVGRESIFSVLQKDINSFDIETEISPVDLRSYRITVAADSKRNVLLIKNFIKAGWNDYLSAEELVLNMPEILRTLPHFFPIMVTSRCPHSCTLCPYAKEEYRASLVNSMIKDAAGNNEEDMPLDTFRAILQKIIDWAGEAVIDISLWGELALHPQKIELIEAVLQHRELSLIIESTGIAWSENDIEKIAALVKNAAPRKDGMAALSWIISLDTNNAARYSSLHAREPGFSLDVPVDFTKKIAGVFQGNVYVQALRCKGNEDDIERFYHYWKEAKIALIIQKYDYFCAALEDLRAGDISPVNRQPCWHIMRDMPILIDGTVPCCRETIVLTDTTDKNNYLLGNIVNEDPDIIWKRGGGLYHKHCIEQYGAFCEKCDEYYTYNF